jgi:hypothetical protein
MQTPERCIEGRLKAELVVELQLANDALDAIERSLIVDDGDHAGPVGLARGPSRTFDSCGHIY